MIVSTVSLKGGAGKTTISINLAVYFAQLGKKVVIVDTDVNNNIKRWNEAREKHHPELPKIDYVVLNTIEDFSNNFDELTEPYDIVLIDGRPAIDTMSMFILNISNYAIFPIKPSPLDMWTNDDVFIDKFIQVKDKNKKLEVAFVLNGVKPHTNISYECRLELMKYEESTEIKTLNCQISDRTDYATILTEGLGAIEHSNLKAKYEIKLLGDEVLRMIDILKISNSIIK